MPEQYTITHYRENGRDIFQEWLDDLRDLQARTSIARSVKNIKNGNFGVHKFCREAVWELVIDKGPGYRVYYSMINNVVIILLCAGNKRSQQKDIEKAITYLKKFKEEH